MGGQFTKITIKDVAQHAGVSTASVSHVINNTRYVSPELTRKVEEAIEELNYFPNKVVASLRSNKTYTVGLVIPSFSNETFGYLAEKIQKIIFQHEYNLIVCSTSYDEDSEDEAIKMLIMKNVDAILMTPVTISAEKIQNILTRGIKVLLIDRKIDGLDVDIVRIDNYLGGYIATQHLIHQGHKDIGYVDRKIDQSHSIAQRFGYFQALKDHGLDLNPDNLIKADGFDYESGETTVVDLLKRNPSITAICVYFDIIALGVMRGIQNLGLNIPGDISVVGYDNMPWTNVVNPRLTTISIPVRRLAEHSCDLILKRLNENEDQRRPPSEILLEPRLIVRESTRPLEI